MIARDADLTERCQRAVLALERQRGDLSDDARAKDGRLEAIRDRHGLLVRLAAAGAGALEADRDAIVQHTLIAGHPP